MLSLSESRSDKAGLRAALEPASSTRGAGYGPIWRRKVSLLDLVALAPRARVHDLALPRARHLDLVLRLDLAVGV